MVEMKGVHVNLGAFKLPPMINTTGRWYGPTGVEIGIDEASALVANLEQHMVVAHDSLATPHDPRAGALTMFVPFDLQPSVGHGPHLYVTVELYTVRQLLRRPRVRQEMSHFAKSRMGALSNHDQAVAHVRSQVRRSGRLWRRIYWHPFMTFMFALYGVTMWILNIIYQVMVLTGHR